MLANSFKNKDLLCFIYRVLGLNLAFCLCGHYNLNTQRIYSQCLQMSKNTDHLSFWAGDILISIFFNSSISYKDHLYLGLYKMPLCICITFPLFPSDGHLGLFYFLTVVKRVTMSAGVQYVQNGIRWVIWKFYFQHFLIKIVNLVYILMYFLLVCRSSTSPLPFPSKFLCFCSNRGRLPTVATKQGISN